MKYYLTQLGRSLFEAKSVEDMRAARDAQTAQDKMAADRGLKRGEQRAKDKRAAAREAQPTLFNRLSVNAKEAEIKAREDAAKAGGEDTSGGETSQSQSRIRATKLRKS